MTLEELAYLDMTYADLSESDRQFVLKLRRKNQTFMRSLFTEEDRDWIFRKIVNFPEKEEPMYPIAQYFIRVTDPHVVYDCVASCDTEVSIYKVLSDDLENVPLYLGNPFIRIIADRRLELGK